MKKESFAVFALAFLLVLASGCVQEDNGGNGSDNTGNGGVDVSAERVESGDQVSIDYRGTLADGTEFDSSIGKRPLEFTAGAGQMIKGFDRAVIGMALNEEKTVTLTPADAYGETIPAKIAEVPKANIDGSEAITVGMTLTNSQGANGVVIEIKDDIIVVDFNHPLAGKPLTFWIKVVGIEK